MKGAERDVPRESPQASYAVVLVFQVLCLPLPAGKSINSPTLIGVRIVYAPNALEQRTTIVEKNSQFNPPRERKIKE